MSPLVDPRRPSTKVPRVALVRPPLFLLRTKIRNFHLTMGCHRSVAAPPLLPLTPQSNALIASRTSSGAHPCHCLLVGCCILLNHFMRKIYVVGVCEHAGALLFHPTHIINNLYHGWLRRGAGVLSLLFVSSYEHN